MEVINLKMELTKETRIFFMIAITANLPQIPSRCRPDFFNTFFLATGPNFFPMTIFTSMSAVLTGLGNTGGDPAAFFQLLEIYWPARDF